MKNYRRLLSLGFVCASVLSLLACQSEPAHIEFGRDWNPNKEVVLDTSSTFHVNDPILAQLYNGEAFGVDQVTLTVYQGGLASRGNQVYTRQIKVKASESAVILKGGGGAAQQLTARGLVGASAAGTYTFEFTSQGKVIAAKELQLTRSQEKK